MGVQRLLKRPRFNTALWELVCELLAWQILLVFGTLTSSLTACVSFPFHNGSFQTSDKGLHSNSALLCCAAVLCCVVLCNSGL